MDPCTGQGAGSGSVEYFDIVDADGDLAQFDLFALKLATDTFHHEIADTMAKRVEFTPVFARALDCQASLGFAHL